MTLLCKIFGCCKCPSVDTKAVEIKQRVMNEDKDYYSLLCGCRTEYIVHGEAKDKRHIVSCACGVLVIEPNYNLEARMYLPYLKMISSK